MAERAVTLVLATSTGGVGMHVRSLAGGLLAAGWRVQVCGPPSTEDLFGFAAVGADFDPVEIYGSTRDLPALWQLKRAVRGSAVVHAHGLRAGLVAALAGAQPLVVSWHNARRESRGIGPVVSGLTERLVARRATVNLVASRDLEVAVRRVGGRDVRFAPVALALAPALRSADEVRVELGVRPGQKLVLAVGRLHSQKALDVLIAAASRWPADDVVVAIAGDGPLESQLRAQIAASRAPVRLLGRRRDVPDLLGAADLVVLTSRWEARSLAAQETLLAGRPLVATRVGGLPELLGDGACLVAPDDVDAVDRAVRSLLEQPQARRELAARGIERAARWPTEAATVAQISAVYTELLGG